MSKIFIEKKEIKFKVQEIVDDTKFEIVDGKYVENATLTRKYISDIYSYIDFNVLFAMENLFDQFYIKIILFNDEKKIGYNLISLSNNLDISVKRVSPKNFLIMGINKDQETQGQASFCSLNNDGSVNEITINFNYINQYKVLEHKYFLLNFIEVLENDLPDFDTGMVPDKKYINTIAIYKEDGTILKIVYEETLNIKRDLVCDVDGDTLLIYYKDDSSVVRKESISTILLG
jgi:hypothetical protein